MGRIVRKVAIDPDKWEKIVRYIFDMPIAFASHKRAVEVDEAINSIVMLDVTINDGQE